MSVTDTEDLIHKLKTRSLIDHHTFEIIEVLRKQASMLNEIKETLDKQQASIVDPNPELSVSDCNQQLIENINSLKLLLKEL